MTPSHLRSACSDGASDVDVEQHVKLVCADIHRHNTKPAAHPAKATAGSERRSSYMAPVIALSDVRHRRTAVSVTEQLLASATRSLEMALCSIEPYILADQQAPPFALDSWRAQIVEACKRIDRARSS